MKCTNRLNESPIAFSHQLVCLYSHFLQKNPLILLGFLYLKVAMPEAAYQACLILFWGKVSDWSHIKGGSEFGCRPEFLNWQSWLIKCLKTRQNNSPHFRNKEVAKYSECPGFGVIYVSLALSLTMLMSEAVKH